MHLPFSEKAFVPTRKLTDYLLSETHAVGKSKAKFFRAVGFNESNVTLLKEGLLAIAQRQPVANVVQTAYGSKYVIDGPLQTPRGFVIHVRTIWIVENEATQPRFVTAYPIP